MKQTVWWTPFILSAAMIFILFVWIDTGEELLVRTLDSPNASQNVASSKQIPILPESSYKTEMPGALELPGSVYQTEVQKCDGRRIFIYDLPAEFNDDLTKGILPRSLHFCFVGGIYE